MAKTIHGVVRTDLMTGTDTGVQLVSAKYMGVGTSDANTIETAVDNGNVLKLGALMTGEREVHKAVTPAANTALKDVILVATPEVMYDERLKSLEDFYNEAGKIVRGYRLHQHDIFGLTAEALNIGVGVTPAVGYVVEMMAGTKLNVVSSLTANSTQVGTIIAIEPAGRYTYYVIEVV